eukprot:CAMPEP_0119128314 /NCGR_PEP_ID=MMETSP1310-20130426/6520_1 /TAXON_ID=464262 /ORGANISM="Genus nov. species nov., Strain RCC2339" /LENGTH=140 /DNA_ID=CAMNT_0007118645 /DNA_START=117 /DNA_END=536 /DNA_ORIENTATION=-
MKGIMIAFSLAVLFVFTANGEEGREQEGRVGKRMKLTSDLSLYLRKKTFGVECTLCKQFVKSIENRLVENISIAEVEEVATYACLNGVDMGYPVTPEVCQGMVHEFASSVIFIMAQTYLSPETICAVTTGACPARDRQPW